MIICLLGSVRFGSDVRVIQSIVLSLSVLASWTLERVYDKDNWLVTVHSCWIIARDLHECTSGARMQGHQELFDLILTVILIWSDSAFVGITGVNKNGLQTIEWALEVWTTDTSWSQYTQVLSSLIPTLQSQLFVTKIPCKIPYCNHLNLLSRVTLLKASS